MKMKSDWISSMDPFKVFFELGFLVFVVSMSVFLYLRTRRPDVYHRRGVAQAAGNERQSPSFFVWATRLWSRSDAEIIQSTSLDGFLFLRYLSCLVVMCFLAIVGLYPVLLAISHMKGNWKLKISADNAGTTKGIWSFLAEANAHVVSLVTLRNENFSWVHLTAINLYLGIVVGIIGHEIWHGIRVRNAYLTSPPYSDLISSRTILVQSLPEEHAPSKPAKEMDTHLKLPMNSSPSTGASQATTNLAENDANGQMDPVARFPPIAGRPTLRLWPRFWKQVDAIDYLSNRRITVRKEVQDLKKSAGNAEITSSFIYSDTQEEAENNVDVMLNEPSLQMCRIHIGIESEDVVWPNTRLSLRELQRREFIAAALIVLCVLFSSIIFISVSSNSNLKSLLMLIPCLDVLPLHLVDFDSGVPLSILLYGQAKLMAMVSRHIAEYSGAPSRPLVQYYVQKSLFILHTVQVVSLVVFSSDAVAAFGMMTMSPMSIVTLLSENMYRVSSIYITYSLLHGFSTAFILLQPGNLLYQVYVSWFANETRREKWNREHVTDQVQWGPICAESANLVVIGLLFVSVNPWLLVCNVLSFVFLYMAYSHHLTSVVRPMESRGIFFPRAMFQILTGVYGAQILLLVHLLKEKLWGCVELQATFFFLTIREHTYLSTTLCPQWDRLPRSLVMGSSSETNSTPGVIATPAVSIVKGESLTSNVGSKLTEKEKFRLAYCCPTEKEDVVWIPAELADSRFAALVEQVKATGPCVIGGDTPP